MVGNHSHFGFELRCLVAVGFTWVSEVLNVYVRAYVRLGSIFRDTSERSVTRDNGRRYRYRYLRSVQRDRDASHHRLAMTACFEKRPPASSTTSRRSNDNVVLVAILNFKSETDCCDLLRTWMDDEMDQGNDGGKLYCGMGWE
jgi:hypothetical protein